MVILTTTLAASAVTIWEDAFDGNSNISYFNQTGSGSAGIEQVQACPVSNIPPECLELRGYTSDTQLDTTIDTTGYTDLVFTYSFRAYDATNGSLADDYCSLNILDHTVVNLYPLGDNFLVDGGRYYFDPSEEYSHISIRLKASTLSVITCLYADFSLTGTAITPQPTTSPTSPTTSPVIVWQDDLRNDSKVAQWGESGSGSVSIYYEDYPLCPSLENPLQCLKIENFDSGEAVLKQTINTTGYDTLTLDYSMAAVNTSNPDPDKTDSSSCSVQWANGSAVTEIDAVTSGSSKVISALYMFPDWFADGELTLYLKAVGIIECYFADFILSGFVATPSPTAASTTAGIK